MFKTYSDAVNSLPADARWSSSFGYPGEGGYLEYWRDRTGKRYAITNGIWESVPPFTWRCGEG